MTVALTSNFLTNARGLQLTDGGGITWSINKNTNAITATVNGASTWPINTGWGTPTGNGILANFPGASATLAQATEVIAELIAVLKSAGMIGA